MEIEKLRDALTWLKTAAKVCVELATALTAAATVFTALEKAGQSIVSTLDTGKATDLISDGEHE